MKKLFSFISLILLFGIATAFHYVEAASPVGTPVDISITSYFDEFNEDVVPLTNVAYGSKVSFDGSVTADDSSYTFLFWQVNGTVNWNLPKDYQFTVTNNLDLVAMFKPADKFAVVFMDSNGELIEVKYVNSGDPAIAPDISGYSKVGLVTNGWSQPFSEVTNDVITYLQYVPEETPSQYTLYVENGQIGTSGLTQATYDFNTVVTVTADANNTTAHQYFKYWRVGQRIVSYSSTYSFTMLQTCAVTAVYGDSESYVDAPVVTVSNTLSLRSGYDSFLGQYYLPSGYTYVEHGLISNTTVSGPTLDSDGTVQYAGTKINASTNEFLISLPNDPSLGTVRGYLVYKDGSDVLHTIYSEIETPELFFSEYGEGSGSNNKWYEIYNPTDSTVNLSDYSVELYVNGGTSAGQTLTFTSETLASGEVYVIGYSASADAGLTPYVDKYNGTANFNGDDALVLKKLGDAIDIIGKIGEDPVVVWNENGITTQDHTLVRKGYMLTGTTNWNPTEWIQYNQDYFNSAGVWGFPAVESITISGDTEVVVGYSIQLSALVEPHGSTQSVYWSSDTEAVATVDANGLVSGLTAGTATITATSTSNSEITDTYLITVSGTPAPTSLTISGATSVYMGSTITLSASVLPAEALQTVTWSSGDTDIATVDASGVVTPVSTGTVTITATSTESGAVLDTHDVTVYYSVTFDTDGGSSVATQSVLSGDTATRPSDPTKANSTFVDWYTDLTFSTVFDFNALISENTIVYAKWTSGWVAVGTELFISEYLEGSSNEKAIEIFNPTDSVITLTGHYSIFLRVNTTYTWTSEIALTGTINPGETYVIVYSSASETLKGYADLLSNKLTFNGDDAVGLFKDSTLIDIFGVFNPDPGSGWTINSITNASVDHTIRRSDAVTDPRNPWDTTEWIVGSINDYSDLGSHTVNPV